MNGRVVSRKITTALSPNTGDVDIGFTFPSYTIITHVVVNPFSSTAAGPCHVTIFVGDADLAMPLAEGWCRIPKAFSAGVVDAVVEAVVWQGRLELGDWTRGSIIAPNVGAFVHNDTGGSVNISFGVSFEQPA